jgi:hypothetical protein
MHRWTVREQRHLYKTSHLAHSDGESNARPSHLNFSIERNYRADTLLLPISEISDMPN